MSKKHIEKIQYCNGHKILLLGNHDIYPAKDYLKYFEDIRATMIENGIIISHLPILLSGMHGNRFIGNIHGHTHEKDLNDSRYLNISWEKLNGYPILLEEAKDILYSQILNT
jgi:calcineurin-like phosphoesterase family protein